MTGQLKIAHPVIWLMMGLRPNRLWRFNAKILNPYHSGKPVIRHVRRNDRDDGKREERKLVIMPYLFGYQKDHPGQEEQKGKAALMMFSKPVPERPRTDQKGQADHPIFKTGIMDNIDAQNG
jgi:hypothetical protein